MSRRVVLAGPQLAPLEAAARLAGLPGRFLLDSASDADGCGRWSFVSAEPARVLRGAVRGDVFVDDAGRDVDPFAAAAELAGEDEAAGDDAPWPRAVGFFGYDLGRCVEQVPCRKPRPADADDLWLGRYDAIWRSDGARAEVVGVDPVACARLHARLARRAPPARPAPRLGALAAEQPGDVHLGAVARALEYIRAGDVYQVNLARRLLAPVLEPGDPLALYARVRAAAPAPYGALVEAGGQTLLSDSPERFLLRAAGSRRVETRPIKGTRARGRDAAEDAALAAALAASDKEQAEHLMIVDLLRNDLGRVARTGSVVVEGFARVVPLPTVHHLVSTVACELRDGATTADLLRATFPGGSITGAPKVRAMEIIEELEPSPRGAYTGALGWLGAGGALELAIIIRTAVLARGELALAVGGGIVADSTPERELEETEEKAAAWRAALG